MSPAKHARYDPGLLLPSASIPPVHALCTEAREMGKSAKVLIVEDDSDLRRLYAIGLNQRGFEVKLAANGAEAVERVAQEEPDVILLDLIMPIMDGWEVIERVNFNGRPRAIPIVVISGTPKPEEPTLPCIVGWLSKPVSLEELVQTISRQF